MAVGITGMQWLDLLESEFDKSFVDLDILIGEVDEEQSDLVCAARQKLTALSTAFAQLTHKCQVVSENSIKIERELAVVREECREAKASKLALQKELHHLLLQLHSAQLQVSAHAEDSELIKQKLETEMELYRTKVFKESLTESQIDDLRNENEVLKLCNVALQSEAFGSKLAAKYLEKELAGRIQQIQLLGKDIKSEDHNRLWEQLEAEIHLHRHKTVIRACQAQRGIGDIYLAPPGHDFTSLKKTQGVGEVRTVRLTKEENEGLGISIIGGTEKDLPIVIAEIHPNSPAWRNGSLYVGDAILSVNGIDLSDKGHSEAVRILSRPQEEMTLEVYFVAPDEDWDDKRSHSKFRCPFFDCHTNQHLSQFMSKQMVDKAVDPIQQESEAQIDRNLNSLPTNGRSSTDLRKERESSRDTTRFLDEENVNHAIVPGRNPED